MSAVNKHEDGEDGEEIITIVTFPNNVLRIYWFDDLVVEERFQF